MSLRTIAKRVAHRLLSDEQYASVQARHWRARIRRRDFPYEHLEQIDGAVSDGDTVLDVGANVGQYAALLARLVGPTGRVIAFEPVPRTFRILQSVVSGLGLANVELVPTALADRDGTASMIDVRDSDGLPDSGLSHIASTGGDVVDVPVARLDTLVGERLRVDSCSFVKIDVEGAELLVLHGAATFLATFRPVLMIELDREMSARFGASPAEVVSFLAGLGYEPIAADELGYAGPSRLFRHIGPGPDFASSSDR